jgi:hypothetical protein
MSLIVPAQWRCDVEHSPRVSLDRLAPGLLDFYTAGPAAVRYTAKSRLSTLDTAVNICYTGNMPATKYSSSNDHWTREEFIAHMISVHQIQLSVNNPRTLEELVSGHATDHESVISIQRGLADHIHSDYESIVDGDNVIMVDPEWS